MHAARKALTIVYKAGVDYFCIDVETSGPYPGVHSLLSMGIVHVSGRDGYAPLGSLYLELKPEFSAFDPRAMAVHKLDLDRLRQDGLSIREGMSRLSHWVKDQCLEDEQPVFVAHNAPFDWMFVAHALGYAGLQNPFGFSALDTKALAMGMLGLSWGETTLKRISRIVRAPHPDPTSLHHAGSDAKHTARVFAALMDRRSRGL